MSSESAVGGRIHGAADVTADQFADGVHGPTEDGALSEQVAGPCVPSLMTSVGTPKPRLIGLPEHTLPV
jgi:hypothetical protein